MLQFSLQVPAISMLYSPRSVSVICRTSRLHRIALHVASMKRSPRSFISAITAFYKDNLVYSRSTKPTTVLLIQNSGAIQALWTNGAKGANGSGPSWRRTWQGSYDFATDGNLTRKG